MRGVIILLLLFIFVYSKTSAANNEDSGVAVVKRHVNASPNNTLLSARLVSSLTPNVKYNYSTSTEYTEEVTSYPSTTKCGVTKYQLESTMLHEESPTPLFRMRRQVPSSVRVTSNEGARPLRIAGGDVSSKRRYVELHLVVDYSLYLNLDRDISKVKKYASEVISHSSESFLPIGIVIVLQQLEIWSEGDKIVVSKDHSVALENFKPYRRSLMLSGNNPDVSVLLTKVNFNGQTVGFAIVSSMCSVSGVAVVEARSSSALDVSHTMTHELGHTLGMIHDEEAATKKSPCVCGEHHWCAMGAQLSSTRQTILPWSNCSLMSLASTFVHGSLNCLENIPRNSSTREPFCGDGVIDDLEQCDCGTKYNCDNPCCDPETCVYKHNATCASGPCCDLSTCSPLPASTLCRQRRNGCDLPEYCSGWSETCPSNTYVTDGDPCDEGQGHCINGKCGSTRMRCETMFGPLAQGALDYCYEGNIEGREGKNCGREPNSPTFKKCPKESVKCGSQYCKPADNKLVPRVGVKLWPRGEDCFTAFASDITTIPELELVPNGAPCGTNKVCMKQECVPLPESKCGPRGCGKHGICNNKGRCHCDDRYSPPYCTTPGFGGSEDSGHSSNPSESSNTDSIIYVVFLLVMPVTVGLIVAFLILNVWWENRQSQGSLPTSMLCNAIGFCCCCSSQKIKEAMQNIGFAGSLEGEIGSDPYEIEKLYGLQSQRRDTICRVDVDVQQRPEPNTWGTASDKLFTDIMTVTPNSSPDMHRRVHLPKHSSPLSHHKSIDQLQRPPYNKSSSTDSGCVSDMDDKGKQINLSMASLVSTLTKFGKGKRSREGSIEPEPINHNALTPQKSMPLRRLVIDPYIPKRNSRPECDSLKVEVPNFSRSISSDTTIEHNHCLIVPSWNKDSRNGSANSLSTKSSTEDEGSKQNSPISSRNGSPHRILPVSNFSNHQTPPTLPKVSKPRGLQQNDTDRHNTETKKNQSRSNLRPAPPPPYLAKSKGPLMPPSISKPDISSPTTHSNPNANGPPLLPRNNRPVQKYSPANQHQTKGPRLPPSHIKRTEAPPLNPPKNSGPRMPPKVNSSKMNEFPHNLDNAAKHRPTFNASKNDSVISSQTTKPKEPLMPPVPRKTGDIRSQSNSNVVQSAPTLLKSAKPTKSLACSLSKPLMPPNKCKVNIPNNNTVIDTQRPSEIRSTGVKALTQHLESNLNR